MENPIPTESLFRRFLENKCTPDEVTQLLEHFRAASDNAQLRKLIAAQLEAETHDEERHIRAVQEVYDSLASQITPPAPRKSLIRPLLWPYLRIAAIWLLLFLAGGAGLYQFWHRGGDHRPVAMRHFEAGTGQKKELILPDSSHIWLNAGSSVDYPAAFAPSERTVSLHGEAFFEVRPDASRPFVIRTGALHTRVVGTSFNIKAYPEDSSIVVSVVTGKVNVGNVSSKTSVDLSPDEQAVYQKSDNRLVSQPYPGAAGLAAWREGKLQFRNKPLREVVRTLERRYGVRISLDARSGGCPVHADFDDSEPVARILEMLAISLNGKLGRQGETGYRLSAGGCF